MTSHPARAEQAAAAHPGARIVATANELFAEPELLDLVVVGTPPASHYALADAALDRGLHVVVDKPFVPISAQGEALTAKARQAGVVLSVYQNRRWDADFLTLKKLIDAGELGRVYTFESRFERWKPEGLRAWKATADTTAGGGILFDLGVHLIDQALTLFGPAATVYGETARHTASAVAGAGAGAGSGAAAGSAAGAAAEEDAFVSLLHESGVRSRLSMNLISALPAPRFHVLGSAAAFTSWGMDGQEAALNSGVPGGWLRRGTRRALGHPRHTGGYPHGSVRAGRLPGVLPATGRGHQRRRARPGGADRRPRRGTYHRGDPPAEPGLKAA